MKTAFKYIIDLIIMVTFWTIIEKTFNIPCHWYTDIIGMALIVFIWRSIRK